MVSLIFWLNKNSGKVAFLRYEYTQIALIKLDDVIFN